MRRRPPVGPLQRHTEPDGRRTRCPDPTAAALSGNSWRRTTRCARGWHPVRRAGLGGDERVAERARAAASREGCTRRQEQRVACVVYLSSIAASVRAEYTAAWVESGAIRSCMWLRCAPGSAGWGEPCTPHTATAARHASRWRLWQPDPNGMHSKRRRWWADSRAPRPRGWSTRRDHAQCSRLEASPAE